MVLPPSASQKRRSRPSIAGIAAFKTQAAPTAVPPKKGRLNGFSAGNNNRSRALSHFGTEEPAAAFARGRIRRKTLN
jgi:hypothetical protein